MTHISLLTPSSWNDYELLDSGNGKRFERFGAYTIVRPDPQILWKPTLAENEWNSADAVFKRISDDKGTWVTKTQIPEKWEVQYKNLAFYAKLAPFKHTGIFPEQSVQWDFMTEVIANRIKQSQDSGQSQNDSPPKVLNLFGYTGIASLACAQSGAHVTHVDASKATIAWARENQELSKLSDKPIRWIVDDALEFAKREVRRGNKYDGIIMDPPAFGHGPTGKVWKFNQHFPELLYICKQLLSDTPLFLIVNAYAISSSSIMLENMLHELNLKGTTEVGELILTESSSKRVLSTGIFGRLFF